VRIIATIALAPVTAACVLFAVSNRAVLTLRLWPLPYEIDMPVYALVLGAGFVGFLAGATVAWIAGARSRRRAVARATAPVTEGRGTPPVLPALSGPTR
jgi:lipopolysaccharide assembly protein A